MGAQVNCRDRRGLLSDVIMALKSYPLEVRAASPAPAIMNKLEGLPWVHKRRWVRQCRCSGVAAVLQSRD